MCECVCVYVHEEKHQSPEPHHTIPAAHPRTQPASQPPTHLGSSSSSCCCGFCLPVVVEAAEEAAAASSTWRNLALRSYSAQRPSNSAWAYGLSPSTFSLTMVMKMLKDLASMLFLSSPKLSCPVRGG